MNEQPWWSPQTANHLIWATALVMLGLIALAGLALYLRARTHEADAKRAAEALAREVLAAREQR